MRDLVDLVTVHEKILPLGAAIWAAVGKSPGFSPEAMIGEIRRSSIYSNEEWRALASTEPIEPTAVLTKLRTALDEAEAFVRRMPTDKAGLLSYGRWGRGQPDPDKLPDYTEHSGRRGGHWPTSPEIAAAMMERLKRGPTEVDRIKLSNGLALQPFSSL